MSPAPSFHAVLDGEKVEVMVYLNVALRMDHIRRHLLVPGIGEVPSLPLKNREAAVSASERVKRAIQTIKRTSRYDNGCLDKNALKELCCGDARNPPCRLLRQCREKLLTLAPIYRDAISESLRPPVPQDGHWHGHCSNEHAGVDVVAVGRGGMKVVLEKAETDYNVKSAAYPWLDEPLNWGIMAAALQKFIGNDADLELSELRRQATIDSVLHGDDGDAKRHSDFKPCTLGLFCND